MFLRVGDHSKRVDVLVDESTWSVANTDVHLSADSVELSHH